MESLPEEGLPIQEVYIKEEIPDDIKMEIKDEEESLDGSSPTRDQEEDCIIPAKSERLDTTVVEGEDQERVDVSSDEENHSVLLQCSVCGKRYLTASSLSAHLSKRHRITLGPRYTCHICGAVGQSKATLKRHLIRTHGEDSIARPEFLRKCRHCGDGLPTQAALYIHISTTHPEELQNYHCCPMCPALVSSRPSLLRHFGRSHPGAKPPGHDAEHCEKCGAVFRSYTALRKHLKESHPESLLHTCKKCAATFKYSYLLTRHTKSAHREQTSPPPVVNQHKCDICGRKYRIQSRLEKHIKLVHTHPEARVFRCTTCNLTFTSNNHRVQHYRAVHRKRKPPHCNECAKSFETVDELNIHRQEHKIDCPVCSKTFVRRDTLREHLLIHNGPKLPCPYCSKTFTQNSNLKRHIRIHTGEKPYKCTFCSKCFGDKSACNSHIRVHTGAERCMCHICGASFSKRQKLTYHMRKHTGEGLLHCPLCTKPTTNSYALKKHIETHQQPLMKVLSNLGTTSVMEDYSEITLTALYNLAHLATQRSSELASKRKMNEQRNMPNSNEMKNQESDMSKEDIESSATAQQGCSTNHKSHNKSKTEDNSQKIRKLKTEKYNKDNKRQSVDTIKSTNEKCLLNDYSKGDDDSIDINNSDCELLQEDSSIVLAEEKEKRDLTGNQKKCFVDNDNGGGHLELVKNAESTPLAPQEQTFGSLILQGTPAVVLMQLIKNIVESHFGSFQAEEVRPTLGDQLVEQCLEVMMHDDTSRSSDDGKNADTYTISSSVCNARVNADEQNISNVNYDSENAGEIVDVFKTDTWLDSSSQMNDKFLSCKNESVFSVHTDNADFCDTKSSSCLKKEKSDRATDVKEMGLFQREVLGDDSCVFSTVAETLTDPLPTFTETKPSHKNTLM